MAREKELTRLRQSRELLKAQSEIHRQLISLEASKVAESLAWTSGVSRAASCLRGPGGALVAAAGVAGAWLARRRLADAGLVLLGIRTFRAVSPLVSRLLGRSRKEPSRSSHSDGSPEI